MLCFSNILTAFGFFPSTRHYEQQLRLADDCYVNFHSIAAKEAFQRYLALDDYINSPRYEADIQEVKARVYKNSPESLAEARYRELKQYKEIKAYIKKGEESDAALLKEFKELHDLVRSSAFKQRVVHLKNKHKHKECDAHKQYLEYRQLKQSGMVKTYFRLRKKYEETFKEMDSWNVVFDDEFENNQLDSRWSTAAYRNRDILNRHFVQNAEQHAVNEKNAIAESKQLKIITRKEEADGMAWDRQFGFVPRKFPYTSGLVSTVDSFQLQYGKIELKLRVPSCKNIYHACWLHGTATTPGISLFNYCNGQLETGIYNTSGTQAERRRARLSPNDFYIVTIEWNKENICWKINGTEICKKNNTVHEPLFLQLSSGVIGASNNSHLPAHFDIDWIRIYKKTT